MEDFPFGNVKAEKATAMRRYKVFTTTISKTLRILELFLVLFLLSWILTRLPFALHVSAVYSRKLFSFLASPLFIFALSNAIIAALLAHSRRLSAVDNADHDGAGLYQQLLNNRNTVTGPAKPPSETDSQPRAAAEEVEVAAVEYQDKEVISETARIDLDRTVEKLDTCNKYMDLDSGVDSDLSKYRRSLSEKWKGEVAGKMVRRKLRRSETEKRLESLYPEDKLSNEEFQRTIEDFIAKQMRFLKEESSAIVVHQNPS